MRALCALVLLLVATAARSHPHHTGSTRITQPTTAVPQPATATTQPVTATTQLVTTTTEPVTATTQPVTATTQPVTATTQPVTATTPPVTATTQPVTATTQPGPLPPAVPIFDFSGSQGMPIFQGFGQQQGAFSNGGQGQQQQQQFGYNGYPSWWDYYLFFGPPQLVTPEVLATRDLPLGRGARQAVTPQVVPQGVYNFQGSQGAPQFHGFGQQQGSFSSGGSAQYQQQTGYNSYPNWWDFWFGQPLAATIQAQTPTPTSETPMSTTTTAPARRDLPQGRGTRQAVTPQVVPSGVYNFQGSQGAPLFHGFGQQQGSFSSGESAQYQQQTGYNGYPNWWDLYLLFGQPLAVASETPTLASGQVPIVTTSPTVPVGRNAMESERTGGVQFGNIENNQHQSQVGNGGLMPFIFGDFHQRPSAGQQAAVASTTRVPQTTTAATTTAPQTTTAATTTPSAIFDTDRPERQDAAAQVVPQPSYNFQGSQGAPQFYGFGQQQGSFSSGGQGQQLQQQIGYNNEFPYYQFLIAYYAQLANAQATSTAASTT